MPRDSVVTIGLLLPDVLGTYSDAGNATVLAQRLRWRGIAARVLRCTADQPPATSCDIYLLGGGEDSAQLFAAGWLREQTALRTRMASSATTLAVCAGLQILGRSMRDRSNRVYPGAELLDITTTPRRQRAIGQVVTRCTLPGVGLLCGFENHRGATRLESGLRALGQVRSGVGNGDQWPRNRGEGVLTERIIGTYLHGPVLARNPRLADHILARATSMAFDELEVPDQAALRAGYL